MDMVTEIYKLTDSFPKREVYSLTDQIRRAAVSVPSNIAEGQAHYSHREFRHFLRHSAGSLAELETQLLLAERLGYADHPSTEARCKGFTSRQNLERLNSVPTRVGSSGYWLLNTGYFLMHVENSIQQEHTRRSHKN